MTPPTLTTERLTLRPLTMDDWPTTREFLASPQARYMGGPFTAIEAWHQFGADVAHWQLLGHGPLAIDAGDVNVGQVGLFHPPHFPEREIGWSMLPEHQGKGYATEAATRMLAFAWDQLGATTCVSYIDADNAASRRVAEKLGAQIDPDARRPDPEDVVYRHSPPETAHG